MFLSHTWTIVTLFTLRIDLITPLCDDTLRISAPKNRLRKTACLTGPTLLLPVLMTSLRRVSLRRPVTIHALTVTETLGGVETQQRTAKRWRHKGLTPA